MNTILVPTDFSPNSDSAVGYAATLASKAGARLILVHACTLLEERYASYKELIREANEKQVQTLTQKLQDQKQQLTANADLEVSVHLYKTDNIADCIVQIGNEKADLVVVGTYGNTGLRRKLFGSKAAEIINRSKKPVITIPPGYKVTQTNKILMAVAANERNEQPFRIVRQIAALYNSKVYLASYTKADAEAHELVTSAYQMQQLAQWAESFFAQASPEIVPLSGTDFQQAIAQYVQEKGIDMLAMITRERGFWQDIFDNSLTQEMSYMSEVPLLSLQRERASA